MPFNVNQFRSALQFDGARSNLFEVFLEFPQDLAVNAGAAAVKTTFMAKATQLPSSTIGIVTLPYFGREIKVPGNRTFMDWTITVINDEDFIIRNAFESWLNLVNHHIDNIRAPLYVNEIGYSRPAKVIQYGKAGDIIKTYDFVGMFPTNIQTIDLDWGDNDSVEEFSIDLTYQYWVSEGIQDF
jgi:hypothetical protein